MVFRRTAVELMALTPLALFALSAPASAQSGAPARGTATPEELVARIESGNGALEAFHALVAHAKKDRIEALTPLDHLIRTTNDAAVRARCRVALDAIVSDYLAEHKKREIEERYEDVRLASQDLIAAARRKKADASATAKLEKALKALEESLASPKPLDAPPLRVPAGGQAKAPPRRPAAGGKAEPKPSDFSGYTKIQVGDKTMLVPSDSLPEHYVAELVDGQLRIVRFDSAKAKEAYLKKKQKDEAGGGKQREPR